MIESQKKYYFESDFGLFSIVCDDNFLYRLDKIKEQTFKSFHEENKLCKMVKLQLNEYFTMTRKEFSIPLKMEGTNFQKKVWQELTEIPYGQTCSYQDIAIKIGKPKACRAVGGANNKNPIIIIVPCHRVIGKNGSLVGYGGGLDLKEKLLTLEKANL
ncbi:MAG: methylated-DNA--[protein]-cysteine S-methyltransferase [Sphaerochaetaceae bacterium]